MKDEGHGLRRGLRSDASDPGQDRRRAHGLPPAGRRRERRISILVVMLEFCGRGVPAVNSTDTCTRA
jgi:hypothetical protein